MFGVYVDGARLATRRWALITALFAISSVFGFTFSLAAAAWLAQALEGSLATRTLLKELDPNVLIDLWYHHREGLNMLAVVAVLLGAGHTVIWWWLHGVVILSVQRDTGPPPDRWRRALEVAPTMAQLFVLTLVAVALLTALVGGPAYVLTRWTRSDPSPWIWYRLWAAAAALWAVGYVFLVAVHDHARIRACRTRSGALACYRWGLGFVLGGGERAFPLALLLQATAVGVWAGYQFVGLAFPMTEIVGITGSLAWGACFLWVRVWVRLWFFASESELHA